MTRIVTEIERFGGSLREAIRQLRESGRLETERSRRMVHVYAELAAIIDAMETEGEIDPKEAERVRGRPHARGG